jgi:uncharacterized membrane protein YraQ (UPF0718 family)
MSDSDGKKGPGRKKHSGWFFLLAVSVFYLGVYWLFPEYGTSSFHHFIEMLQSIAPMLLLVFLFLWIMEFAEGATHKMARLTGHGSGVKGWLIAITGGVLSHGPIYPWYPLLRSLQQQGMRPALVAAFLYARSIKLPWLPLMAFYFGTDYMLILTCYILLFSVPHGWLVEKLAGPPPPRAENTKSSSGK